MPRANCFYLHITWQHFYISKADFSLCISLFCDDDWLCVYRAGKDQTWLNPVCRPAAYISSVRSCDDSTVTLWFGSNLQRKAGTTMAMWPAQNHVKPHWFTSCLAALLLPWQQFHTRVLHKFYLKLWPVNPVSMACWWPLSEQRKQQAWWVQAYPLG